MSFSTQIFSIEQLMISGRDSILFNRSNEVWAGGRELLVYENVGITFTGTLAATGNVKFMNRIASDIYETHPVPEITF